MTDSENDWLIKVPEVIFEKIFRFSDLTNQKHLYQAYRESKQCDGMARVKCHKMEVSCWICMTSIYFEMFWKTGGSTMSQNDDRFSKFKNDPSLNSPGLLILYKYMGEDHQMKYYGQRKLWSSKDMEGADRVFYEFQEKLQNSVFRAKDIISLKNHLDSEHRWDKYMPKGFFDEYKRKISKKSLSFLLEKIWINSNTKIKKKHLRHLSRLDQEPRCRT